MPFLKIEVLLLLRCSLSGIKACLLSGALVFGLSSAFSGSCGSMGEASLYLPGACNIPVAGTGCFCADPSPVFAGVIQYQPPWEGLVSPEGLLPSVASCSNCLTMFSSVG